MGVVRRYLRAFFTDSMELEGNNWTFDFAEEFKARRGYTPRDFRALFTKSRVYV